VPAAVSSKLNELGAEIWTQAVALAEGRLQHEKEELRFARAQMATDRQETASLADSLNAELEVLQQRLNDMKLIFH
jgi:hypothetical protein